MATIWSHMAYKFWVCQWVFKTLPHIFKMKFYFKTWHILMIFFSQETLRLIWAFCPYVQLVNLLISHKYIFFLHLCFFWQVLTRELCKFMGTLWVQDCGSLFKVLQQNVKLDYPYLLVVFSMEDCAHLLFQGINLQQFYICDLSFVFLIDLFRRSMFFRLKGAQMLQSCLRVA